MRRLLVLLAACGPPAAPVRPAPPVDHGAPAMVGPAAPSEGECDALFAHVAALAAADQRTATPETPASDADIAAEQAALHGSEMATCRAMPRSAYACAIAAPSSAQLVTCDQL